MFGLSVSVIMQPNTTEIVHLVDDLVIALDLHPVEKRRRILRGIVRRLIRKSGTGLNVVIIDRNTRTEAEASLEHLFTEVTDVTRTGLTDPIARPQVIENVLTLVSDLASDLTEKDRRRLIEGIRWSGW